MNYPEEITVPMDLIQRIAMYNTIVSGLLEGWSEDDKSFLDQRIKDLLSAEALEDFGHGLPDDITLSSLYNDVDIVMQMLVDHVDEVIPNSRVTFQ